ncbi:MAG: UvrD/REP helicase family protein [Edafosvirus sp.]|uniref:UvrD/REP helicase family protein n=1 Tax=Edafosvirus sp. TaxID=2487765 RepID=A0A3G4ZVM2_9VIRU|nr:MAG: UvrD/REP helicase family protein [Edafosvirus sp.]
MVDIDKDQLMFLRVETTGFPKKNGYDYYDYTDTEKFNSSRIVQLCWSLYDKKGNELKVRNYIIKPDGYEINNSDIHTITTEIAESQGNPIDDVIKIFRKDIKYVKYIIGHNLQFDIIVLKSELHRYDHNKVIEKIDSKKYICIGEGTKNLLKLQINKDPKKPVYKMPKFVEIYKYCFQKEIDKVHNTEYLEKLSEIFYHLKNNKSNNIN